MVTDAELDAMKEYLLIDGSLQDGVIKDLMAAAQEELKFSGVPDSQKDSPLYNLAVKIMVSRNFEDRASTGKNNVNLDYIISKLAICGGGTSDGLQQTDASSPLLQ